MNNIENYKSKKRLAIFRGGHKDYHNSIKSGENIINNFFNYKDDIEIIDIHIDKENNWFERGVPTDAHKVFSNIDFYLDLTNSISENDYLLSKKFKVEKLFENNHLGFLDRVNVKHIFNQLNLNTNGHIIIRDINRLKVILLDAWKTMYPPFVIKTTDYFDNSKSLLSYSFNETIDFITEKLKMNKPVLIEEHIDGQYISILVLNNFRNQPI